MAALPAPLLVAVEEYLRTSYPDGDWEYLDGHVVERHVGTPGHSALQKILIMHLAAFEKAWGLPFARNVARGSRKRVIVCRTCW